MRYADKETEWNINKDYGNIIGSQIDNLKESARKGNAMEWYNELNVLYMLVSQHKKMLDQNVSEITGKIQEIGKNLEILDEHNISKEEKKLRTKKVKRLLFQSSTDLLGMMHNAGLWFEHKKVDISKSIYEQ